MHCLNLKSEDPLVRIKLTEATKCVSNSKKMVVLTGAGISCNAGIPDFRSTNGLYNMVKAKHPNAVVKGKDLFDISLFRSEATLQVFATFMESLYGHTTQATPTETHRFIKYLKRKNKLLRCYTQNIDAIERKLQLNTGVIDGEVPNFKKHWKNLDVVQLHGDLNYLTCSNCLKNYDWSPEYREVLANGEVPDCPACVSTFNIRIANGKRASSSTVGFLRPSIVLYGENHPNSESISKGLSMDIRTRPDCLIIFGTSLKVDGVKKLVKTLAKEIHDKNGKVIFVNKTKPSTCWSDLIDYFIESDCDSWVKFLKHQIPDLFLTQMELEQMKLAKRTQSNHTANKKNILLTPPPTPSGRKPIQDVMHDSSKANKNLREKLQNCKELPLPEFSPLKHDRIIDLTLDSNQARKIKQDLCKFANKAPKLEPKKITKTQSRPTKRLTKLKSPSKAKPLKTQTSVLTTKDVNKRLTRTSSKAALLANINDKENILKIVL